jgi:predicted DCC family thiol-disulfide oxidoreductase YuxK
VRQLLTDTRRYLAELATTLVRGWNAFFFTPTDPTPLGMLRILIGALAFWSLFVLGLDLDDYFATTGWAEPTTIQATQHPLTWSFWFHISDPWLRPAWCASLVVLFLFTIGLFTRVTAVLSWVIVVSTIRRLPIALFGFDQVISPVLLYLAVIGASGQSLSLDRLIRRYRQARKNAAASRALSVKGYQSPPRNVSPDHSGVPASTVSANLSLRLIQLHLVAIYAMAGLAKLQGPSWWSGMALWGTMTSGEFVTLDFTPMAHHPLLLNALTHASLALELLYPIFIWPRLTRPLAIVGMIGLHSGIAIVSPGLTEFGLAMIAANVAFVSGPWLRRLVTGPSQPSLQIFYDGACPRCRASVTMLTASDPDHTLAPIDLTAVDLPTIDPRLSLDECMKAMHALSIDGRITVGYDAVRAASARLPLFWLFFLIGFIPGVAWLGNRVYNLVAATRPRDGACTDDACGIHPGTPREAPRHSSLNPVPDHTAIAGSAHAQEAPRP